MGTKSEPPKFSLVTKEESDQFMTVFSDIVKDLSEDEEHSDMPEVNKRFAQILKYNVPNGKKTRGLQVVAAYKLLEKPVNLTPANIRLANIMGWCVELLQSFYLVTDDIVDRSETRRGAPCWYKREDVGLNAINDAVLLEQGIYVLLKKYFSNHHCYVPTLELFHDATLKTTMGQILDTISSINGKPKLELYTMNRYNAIVKYKAAYYTIKLPITSAMYMANLYDTEMHRQAHTIVMEMGRFFQIQDDFLDCFGDPTRIGKSGTDIREGKCTWLAVMALQKANSAQKKTMEEHYGKPDPESVEKIRSLYEELNLTNAYAMYQEESFNMIHTQIQQMSRGLPPDVFLKLMRKLYKRDC
ncbi:polyprenyl synt domain containing protein [Asbolus verrucosus]|uniref:Farnesyl pyrophosphate synthase n=1 Tax=Asbolus verrucosus TaxID=1661398 RepID=A0A482VKI0_ASBVE|nr:polyprenyl synt domain containing protein [Asbolus verrucosus]